MLEKLSTTIHLHTGLDAQDSLLVGVYVLATWVAEFLPAPPCLNIWGPDGTETILFDLLSCLCRRPLTLLDPSLRQLAKLPESLCPTIFLRRPTEKSLGRLLSTSRDPNVLYGGRLLHLSSTFVFFTTRPLSLPALRVALPVLAVPYRRLPRDQARELHALRGQLLMYRLLHHEQVAQSDFDVPRFARESRVTARILGACMEGNATSQPAIVSALENRDEDEKVQLSQTPKAAVLEGLLVLVHERHAKARIKEATDLANAILHARLAPCTLTAKAAGAIISDVDHALQTHRTNTGYELELDFATCSSIHHHAQANGVLTLLQPHPDCVFAPPWLKMTTRCWLPLQQRPVYQVHHVHQVHRYTLQPSTRKPTRRRRWRAMPTEKLQLPQQQWQLFQRLDAAGCPLSHPYYPLEVEHHRRALGGSAVLDPQIAGSSTHKPRGPTFQFVANCDDYRRRCAAEDRWQLGNSGPPPPAAI